MREAIRKAREEFPDWPERPCLEEWKVSEHPCPWYRYGHECQRPWSDLAHPADYVVMALVYLALVFAVVALSYLLYASRKKRCETADDLQGRVTPPKKRRNKSMVRTMSQDALALNVDGSDKFLWSTYNDYERAVLWMIGACLAQCFAYVDPNGFYKRMSLGVRMCSHGIIRVFLDLTLFQMAAGYRKALKPAGSPRDWGVFIGCILSVMIQAITLTLENTEVPAAGLPGCTHTGWNFARHFATSSLEFFMIFLTLRFALRVRNKLRRSKARGSRHSRMRLQAAVDQIITRTFLLFACTLVNLGWSSFVGARNYGINWDCYQPACNFPDFFSTIFWAVLYVIVTWFVVIFFGVGLPPPIACFGSKPTVSAFCCCCPRPAWLIPATARLSFSSSTDSNDESEISNDTAASRFSLGSITRPFTFAKLRAIFFGSSQLEHDSVLDDLDNDDDDDDDDALFRSEQNTRLETTTKVDAINAQWSTRVKETPNKDRVAFNLSPNQIIQDDYEAALDNNDSDHNALTLNSPEQKSNY